MSDYRIQIAKYALRDRQDRVDAGKLAVFAQCMGRIEELEAKIKSQGDEFATQKGEQP